MLKFSLLIKVFFSFSNSQTIVTQLEGVEKKYLMLKERLEVKYLRNSAYATVMLSKLFEGLPREDMLPTKKTSEEENVLAAGTA